MCDINYPPQEPYSECKGCGAETYDLPYTTADEDYNQRSVRAAREVWLETQPHRDVDEKLPPIHHSHLSEHPEGSGVMWVHTSVLLNAGYTPALDAVIRVAGNAGDVYFELAGTAGHTRAGRPRPGWFLQRIPSPEEMFADLPLAGGKA